MTKSKWYFVIPVLLLLLIDQVMKKDVAIHLANATGNSNIDFIVERQKRVTAAINVLIVVLAVTGMMQYMCLNYMRHNERFSFHRFMLGINRKCDIRRL